MADGSARPHDNWRSTCIPELMRGLVPWMCFTH